LHDIVYISIGTKPIHSCFRVWKDTECITKSWFFKYTNFTTLIKLLPGNTKNALSRLRKHKGDMPLEPRNSTQLSVLSTGK
jgi:hypothetical protein